jgi:hypothetical protein
VVASTDANILYWADLVGEPVESARADTIGGLQVSLGLKPVS